MGYRLDELIEKYGRTDRMHKLVVGNGADALAKATADLGKVTDDLAKMTAERDALSKVLAGIPDTLNELLKRVKNIEEQPAAVTPPRALNVIGKDGRSEPLGGDRTAMLDRLVDELSDEDLAMLAIRKAQRRTQ
jgi:archaellum component FlaC